MADSNLVDLTEDATPGDDSLVYTVDDLAGTFIDRKVTRGNLRATNAETKTAYEANADTNAFTDAEKTKLTGIETAATADQTAGEIKTSYESNADTNAYTDAEKTKLTGVETAATLLDRGNHTGTDEIADVDGLQSSLDAKAPLASPALTGTPTVPTAAPGTNTTQAASTAFVKAAADLLLLATGEYAVNTVATSGATETLTLAPAHHITMDESCTFTFPSPTEDGHTFLLWLSGAFTPTFPASVDWDTATAPTYATPSLYGFTTLDGGTTWGGSLVASGLG